jgi:hypothetical protein
MKVLVIIWVLLTLGISYFFGASFYLALIIVSALGVFGEIVHMPENKPTKDDNSEENNLHPAKTILFGTLLVLVLVLIGHLYPEAYSYGFSKSS